MVKRKLSGLDVATAIVVCLAVLLAAQPGSTVRAPIDNKINEIKLRGAVSALWDTIAATAIPLTPSASSPQLFEFADYECPFCRSMSPAVDSAIKAGARISYVQFPLPIHKHAERAALVALCAENAGQFAAVHQYFMTSDAWQKDTAWSKLPELQSIMNTPAFESCIASPATKAKLAHHQQLAKDLKLTGTPTLIARHEQRGSTATAAELVRMAERQ